jgi:hypothetical protein
MAEFTTYGENIKKEKTLQEKLDIAAKELEPVLWDLLNEIEEK